MGAVRRFVALFHTCRGVFILAPENELSLILGNISRPVGKSLTGKGSDFLVVGFRFEDVIGVCRRNKGVREGR